MKRQAHKKKFGRCPKCGFSHWNYETKRCYSCGWNTTKTTSCPKCHSKRWDWRLGYCLVCGCWEKYIER